MIEFHCPACGKRLRTTDDKAGQTAPCSGCQQPVTVPVAGDGANSIQAGALSAEGSEAGEELKNCPMCGEQVRARANRCRYCGENLQEDDGADSTVEPHRGTLILALSLIGLMTCLGGPCGIMGVVLSIIVLVLAHQDLRAMNEGRMDSTGRGLTQAGRIIAWIQIALIGALMLFYFVLIVFMLLGQPQRLP